MADIEQKSRKQGCITLPKTNSSPLKNGGWETTFLLGNSIFGCYVSSREGITVLVGSDFLLASQKIPSNADTHLQRECEERCHCLCNGSNQERLVVSLQRLGQTSFEHAQKIDACLDFQNMPKGGKYSENIYST